MKRPQQRQRLAHLEPQRLHEVAQEHAEQHDTRRMVQERLGTLRTQRAYPFVHFDPSNGWIRQLSNRAFAIEGLDVAEIEDGPEAIDGHAHKVDLASIEAGAFGWNVCRVVAHASGDGPPIPERFTLEGLRADRNTFLAATDAIVTMPRDRPAMPARKRAAWLAYRQALRDLGAHKDWRALVKAWPLRPDGQDDIAHIRPHV